MELVNGVSYNKLELDKSDGCASCLSCCFSWGCSYGLIWLKCSSREPRRRMKKLPILTDFLARHEVSLAMNI